MANDLCGGFNRPWKLCKPLCVLLYQNVVYKNHDHLLNLQNISVEAEFSWSKVVSSELRLDFLALGSDRSVAFLPIPVLSAPLHNYFLQKPPESF